MCKTALAGLSVIFLKGDTDVDEGAGCLWSNDIVVRFDAKVGREEQYSRYSIYESIHFHGRSFPFCAKLH